MGTYTPIATTSYQHVIPATDPAAKTTVFTNSYYQFTNTALACALVYTLHEVDAANQISATAIPAADAWIEVLNTGEVKVNTFSRATRSFVIKIKNPSVDQTTNQFSIEVHCPLPTLVNIPALTIVNPSEDNSAELKEVIGSGYAKASTSCADCVLSYELLEAKDVNGVLTIDETQTLTSDPWIKLDAVTGGISASQLVLGQRWFAVRQKYGKHVINTNIFEVKMKCPDLIHRPSAPFVETMYPKEPPLTDFLKILERNDYVIQTS